MLRSEHVYSWQPDAVICELTSLEQWSEFAEQVGAGDIRRRAAAAKWAAEFGVRSVHFGHVEPTINDYGDGIHWDVIANGVDNCSRAVLDLIAGSRFAENKADTRVFVAEATSQLALCLRGTYPRCVSSLYLPDKEAEARYFPIQHQDLESLTFPSDAFDLAVSIEVLEHVHDLERSLSEQARILRSGGVMLATFPFKYFSQPMKRRADIKRGEIVHLVPEPEYHGDPLRKEGILVFHDIGWDVVGLAERAGFSRVNLIYYSSVIGGIFGHDLMGRFVLAAHKA